MIRFAVGAAMCGIITIGAGEVRSDPLPPAILGAWSPVPGCPSTAHRMTLAAHRMTVAEGNGKVHVVAIDGSGKVSEKLQIRITELPQDTKDDPDPPHIGDSIFVKLDKKGLTLVGVMEAGVMKEPPQGMLLLRCR